MKRRRMERGLGLPKRRKKRRVELLQRPRERAADTTSTRAETQRQGKLDLRPEPRTGTNACGRDAVY